MARTDPFDDLPVAYAVALRLHDAGATDTLIAVGLGIECEAVPIMLDVARRKLDAALTGHHAAPAPLVGREDHEPDG